jgi:hypothetical protein
MPLLLADSLTCMPTERILKYPRLMAICSLNTVVEYVSKRTGYRENLIKVARETREVSSAWYLLLGAGWSSRYIFYFTYLHGRGKCYSFTYFLIFRPGKIHSLTFSAHYILTKCVQTNMSNY